MFHVEFCCQNKWFYRINVYKDGKKQPVCWPCKCLFPNIIFTLAGVLWSQWLKSWDPGGHQSSLSFGSEWVAFNMSKELGLQPWCFHVEMSPLEVCRSRTHWRDFISPLVQERLRISQEEQSDVAEAMVHCLACRHHDMDPEKWWKMDCGWMPELNAWLGLCKQVHQTWTEVKAGYFCVCKPCCCHDMFLSLTLLLSKRLYSFHILSHGSLDKCYLYIPPSSVDWSVCFLSWFTVCR